MSTHQIPTQPKWTAPIKRPSTPVAQPPIYKTQPVKAPISGRATTLTPAQLELQRKRKKLVEKAKGGLKRGQPPDWKPATEAQIRAGTHGGENMTAEQVANARKWAPTSIAIPKRSLDLEKRMR